MIFYKKMISSMLCIYDSFISIAVYELYNAIKIVFFSFLHIFSLFFQIFQKKRLFFYFICKRMWTIFCFYHSEWKRENFIFLQKTYEIFALKRKSFVIHKTYMYLQTYTEKKNILLNEIKFLPKGIKIIDSKVDML